MNADYFAVYSTADLVKLLDQTPGESATHRAAEEELRRRETEAKRDTQTRMLFNPETWDNTKRP